MTALALAGNGPGAEPQSLIMFGSLRPQEPPHGPGDAASAPTGALRASGAASRPRGRRLGAHGRAPSLRSRLTPRDAASLPRARYQPQGPPHGPGDAASPPTGALRASGAASRAGDAASPPTGALRVSGAASTAAAAIADAVWMLPGGSTEPATPAALPIPAARRSLAS